MSGPKKRLTDYANCAGCAGKLPARRVAEIVRGVPRPDDPNLLVGTETSDDAGVYRVTEGLALVQTVDFFPPLVDDPFQFGQIAAANALSDVYAMNGRPLTVLNLVMFPDDELPDQVLTEILRGAADRVLAAGAVTVGGHSLRDTEIKFGLSVTGVVEPSAVLTNATARAGDVLVLTKPLGTGFITTANKKGECPREVLERAIAGMIQLNAVGRAALNAAGGIHAVTDVTGFGLAGHAAEMADGSGVTVAIELGALPVIAGSESLAIPRYHSRATGTNRAHLAESERLQIASPAHPREAYAFDPQTSGGLLVAVAPECVERFVAELETRGAGAAAVVGRVLPRIDSIAVVLQ
jgi:selenide,water dikinase